MGERRALYFSDEKWLGRHWIVPNMELDALELTIDHPKQLVDPDTLQGIKINCRPPMTQATLNKFLPKRSGRPSRLI